MSQIPLNHMLKCAVAAGVPLNRSLQNQDKRDLFAMHPDLIKAFDDFIMASTLSARPMHAWLQPYLNWGWQMRHHFHTTKQVRLASQAEREILIAFNRTLVSDAAVLDRTKKRPVNGSYRLMAMTGFYNPELERDISRFKFLDPEARSVLELAQKAQPTVPSLVCLFENYVHDSLAGFNLPNVEIPGYWRYRKIFLGGDDYFIAVNQDANPVNSAA